MILPRRCQAFRNDEKASVLSDYHREAVWKTLIENVIVCPQATPGILIELDFSNLANGGYVDIPNGLQVRRVAPRLNWWKLQLA